MGATFARPGHGPKYIAPAGPSRRAAMKSTIRLALTLGLLTAAACGREEATDDDRLAVYAEVIRHMTTEQGQSSGFQVIYVLERLMENDRDPDDPGSGRAISPEDQRALIEALRDVAPLEFVPTRSEVVGPMEDGGRVQNEGIFVTLGPISGGDERLLVPATTYLGNLAATWQTWVVERVGDRWRVTGTEGPVAIS